MDAFSVNPSPIQPSPKLVPTVEKIPGAGTTLLPFELDEHAEGRDPIPLVIDATGYALTQDPVQITPVVVATVEKNPGAGTTRLPVTLHNRSEGRDGIPAPFDPSQKTLTPPVGVLAVAKTTLAPNELNTYTITLNRHPSQKIITIILQYGYVDMETYGEGFSNQFIRGNLNSPPSTVFTGRTGSGDPETLDLRYRVRVIYRNPGATTSFISDSQPIILHVVQP